MNIPWLCLFIYILNLISPQKLRNTCLKLFNLPKNGNFNIKSEINFLFFSRKLKTIARVLQNDFRPSWKFDERYWREIFVEMININSETVTSNFESTKIDHVLSDRSEARNFKIKLNWISCITIHLLFLGFACWKFFPMLIRRHKSPPSKKTNVRPLLSIFHFKTIV